MRLLMFKILAVVGFAFIFFGGLGLCGYMLLHSSSWPEIFLSLLASGVLLAVGSMLLKPSEKCETKTQKDHTWEKNYKK